MEKRGTWIYLDDVRTPKDLGSWVVVRNHNEFVEAVEKYGLENIETISLDHDLDESAMEEYHNNVSPNYILDYNNITEKTGMDSVKFLIEKFYATNTLPEGENTFRDVHFPTVYVHSANPIGSANMMGYINNFLMNERKPQTCVRVKIPFVIND